LIIFHFIWFSPVHSWRWLSIERRLKKTIDIHIGSSLVLFIGVFYFRLNVELDWLHLRGVSICQMFGPFICAIRMDDPGRLLREGFDS
jgi:hypothetical protein